MHTTHYSDIISATIQTFRIQQRFICQISVRKLRLVSNNVCGLRKRQLNVQVMGCNHNLISVQTLGDDNFLIDKHVMFAKF